MTTYNSHVNNEIDAIVAEVSNILRNRLNSLVTNVKNDENNEAVLNLPIVKKVLETVGKQETLSNSNNTEMLKLQADSASAKQDIQNLFAMCSQISKAVSDMQSSINALTTPVSPVEDNIKMKIVEKEPTPVNNIIFIEEEELEEEAKEEEVVEEEVVEEAVVEEEVVVEEKVVEEEEEVVEEAVVEEEVVEEEVVVEEAKEEEADLEVFEIEIDDVTYFATDEENGDLYEVAADGDIGKKVGFIKDGEVEFI